MYMNSTLKVLIVFGLVVWGILMYQQYHPPDLSGKIQDANTADRCAKYRTQVDGEEDMSYGDRFRQFSSGCW